MKEERPLPKIREHEDGNINALMIVLSLFSLLVILLIIVQRLDEPRSYIDALFIIVCMFLFLTRLVMKKLSRFVDLTLFGFSDVVLLYLLVIVVLGNELTIANVSSVIVALTIIIYSMAMYFIDKMEG